VTYEQLVKQKAHELLTKHNVNFPAAAEEARKTSTSYQTAGRAVFNTADLSFKNAGFWAAVATQIEAEAAQIAARSPNPTIPHSMA
jgi:negative regulator of sigma E activity